MHAIISGVRPYNIITMYSSNLKQAVNDNNENIVFILTKGLYCTLWSVASTGTPACSRRSTTATCPFLPMSSLYFIFGGIIEQVHNCLTNVVIV